MAPPMTFKYACCVMATAAVSLLCIIYEFLADAVGVQWPTAVARWKQLLAALPPWQANPGNSPAPLHAWAW